MTLTVGLLLGEGAGVGFPFGESPPAVRVTTVDGVLRLGFELEGDAGGVLLGWAAGVSEGKVEVEVDDDDNEVGGGWPSVRNFERMLEASLGETVVVVVELTELPVTVTVTVTWLGLPFVENVEVDEVELDVEELLDNGMVLVLPFVENVEVDEVELDVEELLDNGVVLVELSSPVMPPLTPAACIRPRTVLSLVQRRTVPGARTFGTAKHWRLCGH